MQFMQFPQPHTYSSLSGLHAVQSAPDVAYIPPISVASAQQYPLEPTQVISTVMETVQVTETIMVPQQVTKTIQVPKQVISTIDYGAEGENQDQPQFTQQVSPAPAWLLREDEISCIYEEMDRQVLVMTLIFNRLSA